MFILIAGQYLNRLKLDFIRNQTYCYHILISGDVMSSLKSKISPEEIFQQHGGQLRMSKAIQCGISRYALYKMRDNGVLEQVSRGIYRQRFHNQCGAG